MHGLMKTLCRSASVGSCGPSRGGLGGVASLGRGAATGAGAGLSVEASTGTGATNGLFLATVVPTPPCVSAGGTLATTPAALGGVDSSGGFGAANGLALILKITALSRAAVGSEVGAVACDTFRMDRVTDAT